MVTAVGFGCTPTPTYYEHIKPIMDGRCVACHQDGGVAPFTFETAEDVTTLGDLIHHATDAQTMPPWFAVDGFQNYRNNPSLSEEQRWLIAAWNEGGRPMGNPNRFGQPLPQLGTELARLDLTLAVPEPFEVTNTPDEYRCFVLDWTPETKQYITGFSAQPGNLELVHHMAAYLFRPDTPYGEGLFDILQRWDDENPGIGYPCYGGPSGDNDVQVPIQQIAQWVPGMGDSVFPSGSGIEVPVDSKVVLQIHYNTLQANERVDQSKIVFSTADNVQRQGAFAPWLDTSWPLGNMTIPAGESNVTRSALGSPFGLFGFLAPSMDFSNGFDVHSILIHMHQLGQSSTVAIQRANGQTETLLRVEQYDFNWQLMYELNQPIAFAVDDELYLTCTWDNSEANQPDGEPPNDVNWGEGTQDEMCVANLFITERNEDYGE